MQFVSNIVSSSGYIYNESYQHKGLASKQKFVYN